MYEKWIDRISLIIYFAFALIGVALSAVILKILDIKDPAAWLQAVGSIVAIGVAIFIMNEQTIRAKNDQIEQRNYDDARKVKIIRVIFNSINSASEYINIQFNKTDGITTESQRTNEHTVESINKIYFYDMKDALTEVPLWDFPEDQLVVRYAIVLRRLTDFIQSVETAQNEINRTYNLWDNFEVTPDDFERMEQRVSRTKKDFFNMHDAVQAAIKQCDKALISFS